MTILEKMLGNCESYGLKPTENIEKVAKAKSRMFGEEAWRRCPCDGENEKRYCVSELCRSDIERNGVCLLCQSQVSRGNRIFTLAVYNG